MKWLAAFVLVGGLAFIWRRDATADGEGGESALGAAAADAPAGLAPGDATAGSKAVDLDVANTTTNAQNTITIGNNANVNNGGDLILGGGSAGGLATGEAAGGSGGNTVANEQNTITVGNNSVFHVGSGRRPARSDDFAAFWNANQFAGPYGTGNASNWLRAQGNTSSPADLEGALNANTVPAPWRDWMRAQWNSLFGNSVAFPGDPIT